MVLCVDPVMIKSIKMKSSEAIFDQINVYPSHDLRCCVIFNYFLTRCVANFSVDQAHLLV